MCNHVSKWFCDKNVIPNAVMFYFALSNGICLVMVSALNLYQTRTGEIAVINIFMGLALFASICVMIGGCCANRKYIQANETEPKDRDPTQTYSVANDDDDHDHDHNHDENGSENDEKDHHNDDRTQIIKNQQPQYYQDPRGSIPASQSQQQHHQVTGSMQNAYAPTMNLDKPNIDKQVIHNAVQQQDTAFEIQPIAASNQTQSLLGHDQAHQQAIPTTPVLQTLQIMQ